jgi:hypothetical protein
MYFAIVVLLLLVLPGGSVAIEVIRAGNATDTMMLVGKWFVFWGVGIRLFLAGIRQVLQPKFTAEDIFAVKDSAAQGIVREVGFANLAMGLLGLLSLPRPSVLAAAAIVSGLYYGLAGIGHLWRGHRNFAGQTAMVSDFWMFAVLAVFVATRGFY